MVFTSAATDRATLGTLLAAHRDAVTAERAGCPRNEIGACGRDSSTRRTMSMITKAPKRPALPIAAGLALAGLGISLFTQAPTILIAWLTLAIASLALTWTQIIAGTQAQHGMPRHFLGTLGGLNAISQSGLPGIGAAVTATAAHTVGSATALITSAAIMVPLGATALGCLHRTADHT
jgi:hypothetical protein